MQEIVAVSVYTAELVAEYTESCSKDEDPLVTIRKQELALKGQELDKKKNSLMQIK